MELPIENVYQQSPRDERSTQWGPYNFSNRVSGAISSITVGGEPGEVAPWNVPAGYVASIKTASMDVDPGAGQNVVQATMHVTDAAGNFLLLPWRDHTTLGADVELFVLAPIDIILTPKHFFGVTVVFNSGTNSNAVFFDVQAILMPQGNIAAF